MTKEAYELLIAAADRKIGHAATSKRDMLYDMIRELELNKVIVLLMLAIC